jgi:hypothetical protein
MTVYDLIHKLSQYPADTKVMVAQDWSEPLVDDEYLIIEGDPTLAIHGTGHAIRPDELARLTAATA